MLQVEHPDPNSPTGKKITSFVLGGQVQIKDNDGNPLSLTDLIAGDEVRVVFTVDAQGTVFTAGLIERLKAAPRPGMAVDFHARVVSISGSLLTIRVDEPGEDPSQERVILPAGLQIKFTDGTVMQLSNLSPEDRLIIQGVVAQDAQGLYVDARQITYQSGAYRRLGGTVVALRANGFDLETRNETGQVIFLQVTLDQSTSILRFDNQQPLTAAAILKGLSVQVTGVMNAQNVLQARTVLVPPPVRAGFGGQVASIGTNSFMIDARRPEDNAVFRVEVAVKTGTVWLKENAGVLTPGARTDLRLQDLVQVVGLKTGSLSLEADTVRIQSRAELQVQEVVLQSGAISGNSFTFSFQFPAAAGGGTASGRLAISPDWRQLQGGLVRVNAAGTRDSIGLSLSKVSGDVGKLTGLWSGVSIETRPVQLTAELFQSGSTVTGKVKFGAAAQPGTGGSQVGQELRLTGKITSVTGSSLVLTYQDQVGQNLQQPVLVHNGTKYQDSQGRTLAFTPDSLLNRKVTVTGLRQADFSLLANLVSVEIAATGNLLSGAGWNTGTRTVTFTLPASRFDSASTKTISFQLTLGPLNITLSGNGVTEGGGTAYTALLTRVAGTASGPAGTFNGSVSATISDRVKSWPLLLELQLPAQGALSGSYQLGEGRIRTDVVLVQNRPPEIQEIPLATGNEGQQLTIPIKATDPEGDAITLSIQGLPLPGSSFTDQGGGNGSYVITLPTVAPGREELLVSFSARDAKGATTSRLLKIAVRRINHAPEFGVVPQPLLLLEGRPFSFTIPASDPDGDPLTFQFQGLPPGATLQGNVIGYTPPFGSAGNYSLQVTVNDGKGGSKQVTVQFTVQKVNRPPRFVRRELVEGQAGSLVSFTLEAADPDAGDALTFSVPQVSGQSALPPGATFDPATRTFNWTPSAQQLGPFKISFQVADQAGERDQMLVNVFIGAVNLPPVLTVTDSMAVNEGARLEFTLQGSTQTGKPLRYAARELPRGATFNPDTRTFNWTPEYGQAGNYRVVAGVSDGSFRTERDVKIAVLPVIVLPTIAPLGNFTVPEGHPLAFQVTATYPDGRRAMFDQPTGLPVGAGFDRVTGAFRFLPAFDQAGTYPLSFAVTERDGQKVSAAATVTVTNANRAPRLFGVENYTGTAGTALALPIIGRDLDPGDRLALATENLPAGATIIGQDSLWTFSWTPSAEGNFSVNFTLTDAAGATDVRTVNLAIGSVNQPPAMSEIGELIFAEGDTLRLTITTSDPEGDAVTVFASPLPENSVFDRETGTFSFMPSFSQAGVYYVKFMATDGELSDAELVPITVADVSRPPSILVPGQWNIGEGEALEFTVEARDADNGRLDVISPALPGGAWLESSTGRFRWTPSNDQAGDYQVTFIAGDGIQSAQQDVSIHVDDRNRPPQIFEISDQEVKEGELISFEITTTDPDGDPVTIAIDSSATPYIASVDIRNNSVFVFNTALLEAGSQIPSAVFRITASDGRGGVDRRGVAFKITREHIVEVPPIEPGIPFNTDFTGMGLQLGIQNQGLSSVTGEVTGSEVSGEMTGGQPAGMLLASAAAERYAYLGKSKDRVQVLTFLSADGSEGGDFYGIRRGWGLDLSSAMLGSLGTLKFEITLKYEDRDIPAQDIPEFTENGIAVFGRDAEGNFTALATTLDPVANTARAEADLSRFTDYTLGMILDLQAPMISGASILSNTTDELGPYRVSAIVMDNVLVRSAKLWWAVEGGQYAPVTMNAVTDSLNRYAGLIPGQAEGKAVLYYLEVGDSSHTVTDPANAPSGGTYRFTVMMDGAVQLLPGDVDASGVRNIFDLLDLLRVLGGSQPPNAASDVNGSGRTDIFDLLELLRLLAG